MLHRASAALIQTRCARSGRAGAGDRPEARATQRLKVVPSTQGATTKTKGRNERRQWEGFSRTEYTRYDRQKTEREKEREHLRKDAPARKLFRRRPTLPHGYPCSTIGAGRLNFRVRDGIGWNPSAMATGNLQFCREISACSTASLASYSQVTNASMQFRSGFDPKEKLKPHGQLVLVSSTHYCASTPSLSTS